jgi:uncharacterized cupin superfamily protein
MTRVATSAFRDDGPFEEVAADVVLAGSPSTSARELWSQSGVVEAGVWVMTPGTSRDTEAEEIFVVLAGRATITIGDADPRTVSTGDIVSFREGDQTIWHVHETLRKFYAIRASTDME